MRVMTAITRDFWAGASEAERVAAVDQVLAQLPSGSSFDSFLPTGAALLCLPDGAEAVLVPGGTATLGLSVAGFVPPESMLQMWPPIRDSVELYASMNLLEYLDRVTSPRREVQIPTLVVECNKRQQGWRRLPERDPAADTWAAARQLEPHRTYRSGSIGDRMGQLRIRTGADPSRYEVDERVQIRHGELLESMREQGFGLLNRDEWEYCCGAGARSLFRWGGECPWEHYPDDTSWEQLPRLHQPNGFGLFINQASTYAPEVLADPKERVGGDGGARIGAGLPPLLVWMVLASAFVETVYPVRERVDGAYARRAIAVE